MDTQQRIVVVSRPDGVPRPDDFALETVPVPRPAPGEILVRTRFLSLDPYLRGRMGSSATHSSTYAPVPLGGVMEGNTAGEVVLSADDGFAEGALVAGSWGWQEYAAVPAGGVRRLDPELAPVSTALGILGMPGLTGYAGLTEIGRPAAGETLVVAAATGTVGALVGQLARLRGARVVGIAGGARKTAWLREAGFDAAIDHRSPDFVAELASETGHGIDVYFENVGGRVWDAVWPRLNRHARVPVCGWASSYSSTAAGSGDVAALMSHVVSRGVTIQGFVWRDYEHLRPVFEKEVAGLLQTGAVIHHEEVVDGLDQAPAAFLGMLAGDHLGKRLVRMNYRASMFE